MRSFISDENWILNEGIYYYQDSSVDTAFNDKQQDEWFGLDSSSWWFEYRAKVIKTVIMRYFSLDRVIIDIGGGNGFTAHEVMNVGYDVALLEPSKGACFNSRKRGIRSVYCGPLTDNGIVDETIESAMLLDVLEHIKDDGHFLGLLNRKMKENGRVVITVPGFMSLWSSEDVSGGHFRRYQKDDLIELAELCGFRVMYCSYFMSFLYLPVLIIRVWFERIGLIKRREHRSSEEKMTIRKKQFEKKKGIIGSFLLLLEKIELKKLESGGVPFGSSIVMVLEKEMRLID